jgi:hypothetical protein
MKLTGRLVVQGKKRVAHGSRAISRWLGHRQWVCLDHTTGNRTGCYEREGNGMLSRPGLERR